MHPLAGSPPWLGRAGGEGGSTRPHPPSHPPTH
jgi:hypothetical protein